MQPSTRWRKAWFIICWPLSRDSGNIRKALTVSAVCLWCVIDKYKTVHLMTQSFLSTIPNDSWITLNYVYSYPQVSRWTLSTNCHRPVTHITSFEVTTKRPSDWNVICRDVTQVSPGQVAHSRASLETRPCRSIWAWAISWNCWL